MKGKLILLTIPVVSLVLTLSEITDEDVFPGLQRGKEHIDRLNMSRIYPFMENEVLREIENNNLTQADPQSTVEYLRGILRHALGIVNLPKRYFKKQSVVLVKQIIMDLRTDMAKLDDEKEDISMFYNDTQEEKERYYRTLEECKSLFVLLDMKFNRVGNHSL